MIYTPRIKLDSAFLGSQYKDKVMIFVRDKDHKMLIPTDQWEWAVEEATASLRLSHVATRCFLPPSPIYLPTTVMYNRNYSRGGNKESCMHEAVKKGAELVLELPISSSVPPRSSASQNLVPPEPCEIEQVLKFIGKFLGLSPFGSEKGYGRFSLLSIEQLIPKL